MRRLTDIKFIPSSPSYREIGFRFGDRYQAARFDIGDTNEQVARRLDLLLRNIVNDVHIIEPVDTQNPDYKVKIEPNRYNGTMVSTTQNGYQWSTIAGNKEELLEVARKIEEYFKND